MKGVNKKISDELKNYKISAELRPFFFPRAIAVLGVSRETWKFGSCTFSAIYKFAAGKVPVYPVSSRIAEFMGLKVYTSISTLPDEVDLVVICLPSKAVPEAVRECVRKRIRAVIIPSGGFRESKTEEGTKLEAELVQIAGKDIRIIGPNCFGVYSPAGGVTIITGGDYSRKAGTVGFFTQSGAMMEDVCNLALDYDFLISQAVSYGNGCDINELDLARYFQDDPNTKIVAAYLEGVKKGREFFETVQKCAKTKPTIIFKGGLTAGGARAAASHTGSLAGNDKVWATFFKQSGAIQVYTIEDLLDTLSAFYHLPHTADSRVAVVCGAGGVGVMASDACSRAGLTLATFEEQTINKLKSILPPPGSNPHNPVDCDNPHPRAEVLRDALQVIAASGNTGSIVIDKIAFSKNLRDLYDYSRELGWEDEDWIEEIPIHIRHHWDISVVVVIREGGGIAQGPELEVERQRLRSLYQQNGIAVYPSVQRAMNALGRMTAYYKRTEGGK